MHDGSGFAIRSLSPSSLVRLLVQTPAAMVGDKVEVSSTAAASGACGTNDVGEPRSSQPVGDAPTCGVAGGPLVLREGVVPTSSVSTDIAHLLAEQKRVREERKQITNDLRNAQRRRQRLKHKARLLSKDDLHSVMALRLEEEMIRENKAAKAQRRGDDDRPQRENNHELTAMETEQSDVDPGERKGH